MAVVKDIYSNLNLRKAEILIALRDGWKLSDIESRYDHGRSARVSKWLKLCYGRTFAELRKALDDNLTAIAAGDVYYAMASPELINDIAMNLELKANPGGVKDMPNGQYHIWLFEDLVCVQCNRHYGSPIGTYKRIYRTRLNTDDYPQGALAIRSPANTNIPLMAEDIADVFGLLWVMRGTHVKY